MVEHAAVNRVVVGSSPTSGAILNHSSKLRKVTGLPGNSLTRSAEFCRRCRLLNLKGISLHSYRYAWAERAKVAGMPERFAQEALGHNSKAVHRAYAKRALVKIPSLEDYEEKNAS